MQHSQEEENHIWFTTPKTKRNVRNVKKKKTLRLVWGGGLENILITMFVSLLYLFANFWWDILVGKPDLDIRTTSRTPQHLNCCSTSPCSYDPGDWRLLGLMQRIKWGVVLSKRCISWNNCPWVPTKISCKDNWNQTNIPSPKLLISNKINKQKSLNKPCHNYH